jgi:hypothetical protein
MGRWKNLDFARLRGACDFSSNPLNHPQNLSLRALSSPQVEVGRIYMGYVPVETLTRCGLARIWLLAHSS